MRREFSEIIDPVEIQRILSSTNIGRMATIGADGYPYITPVNFISLHGNIYFHCAPKGEKLDNLTQNPQVCFEVDIPLAYLDIDFDPNRPICHLHQFYHCVIIRGTASVVQEDDLKVDALNALIRKHDINRNFEAVNAKMALYKACKVIEIKPVAMTAKSDLAQNKTLEERRAMAEYLFKRNHPGDRETVEAMGFHFE
jgi:nitroimidazol reductase NimA-like FMN-containing flavoprotein (pyridoxamine 5'-phosphate oxidase superfamily)